MNESPNLIDSLIRMRAMLLREADAVPPRLRQTPFVGHWNLMDLLAHLAGWDYTNLTAIEEFTAGRMPDFYRHFDPGWATYNQQLIDRHGAAEWDVLRDSLRQSQAAVVDVLRALTIEDLTKELSMPGRRRPVTIAGLLRAAIRDEREHLGQIRAFVDAQRMGSG